MEPDTLIREYLLLGLRFDRVEDGYVDSFIGDPALRRAVASEPAPDPADLVRRAQRLLVELPQVSGLDPARADYLGAHLRALACAGHKFAGEPVGFVDEVEAYFDVRIAKSDPEQYRQAHRKLDEALGGTGPLADRMAAYRSGEEIPPERLAECIDAFSSALRDRVRAEFPLPDTETVVYEVVTDKPWSGFNYYLGDYRSTVAVNADLKQQMSNLPRLVAHESYPGHHTTGCCGVGWMPVRPAWAWAKGSAGCWTNRSSRRPCARLESHWAQRQMEKVRLEVPTYARLCR